VGRPVRALRRDHLERLHAVAAIDAVLGIAAMIESVVLVSEIRTVAADSLWLSPQ
jgi:alditol oxidase